MGAHIGGYAGERIKNLGRITGLDPAKPYFTQMSRDVRLDPTDANFVEIIHTNAPENVSMFYGLGDPDLLGHNDYFPNGGNNQPGCSNEMVEAFSEGLSYVFRKLTICNHARSLEFYIEAMQSTRCPFIGFKCDNFQNFKLGKCYLCGPNGDDCKLMGVDYYRRGFKSPNHKGFYFLTNHQFPYCVFHFRVEVRLGKVPKLFFNTLLFFHARIHSDKNQAQGYSPVVLPSDQKVVSFIITGPNELRNLGELELKCYKSKLNVDYLSSLDSIEVIYVKVTPISYLNDGTKFALERTYAIGHLPVSSQPEMLNLFQS